MEFRTINFTLPIGIFSVFKKTPEEFSKAIRLTAAVKRYEMGMISHEKAPEVAGISREDFLLSLGKFKVSPFQYSAEEILSEADYD